MAAHKAQLIGYWLPPNVRYLNLEQALNLLETELRGLPKSWTPEERKEYFLNTILSLINNNFCQAFISHNFNFDGKITEDLYEVPYLHMSPEGSSEGNYRVGFNNDKRTACCGDYSGDLILPADSFRSGLDVFKMKWFSPDKNEENKTARMHALMGKAGTLKSKSGRLEAIGEVLKEAGIRAQEKGYKFDIASMPGTKKDFTDFLKKLFKEFGNFSEATFHNYYDECGLKFNPGRHSGETKIWEELFSD